MKKEKYKRTHGKNPSKTLSGFWGFINVNDPDKEIRWCNGKLEEAGTLVANALGCKKKDLEVQP